jgi:hypothetical protein
VLQSLPMIVAQAETAVVRCRQGRQRYEPGPTDQKI